MSNEYLVSFTVISDREHPPITISTRLPEPQALILMATPVKAVSVRVGRATVGTIQGTELIDFR